MPRPRFPRWLPLVLVAVAATTVAYFLPLLDWIAAAQIRIETFGVWSPILYVVLYILFTLALIPGSALTFTAGLLYGAGRGTAISLSASTIAAVIAFLVARYFFREPLARRFAGSPRFQALDRAVAGDAWKIVVLMRLSPAFPYVLLNYAFGLTRVRLTTFTFFSLVGMIPATLLLTTAAAALGEAADRARQELAEAGTRAPSVLTENAPANAESVRAGISWLRNRQLMLWRDAETQELPSQQEIANLTEGLIRRVGIGEATAPAREGEPAGEAQERTLAALKDAAHEARSAIRYFADGRPGTARDRQKRAAERFSEARGDASKINWGLWSAIGASLLVSVAVGRAAQKALASATGPAAAPA